MNLSIYVKEYYGVFEHFRAAKKQSQFKANLDVLPPRTPSARRFLICNNSRWCSWLGNFVSSAFSANSAVNRIWKNKANLFRIVYCILRIAKSNLKKQSQFQTGWRLWVRKNWDCRSRCAPSQWHWWAIWKNKANLIRANDKWLI